MSAEPPRRIRRAARILVEADDEAVLLFRFTPSDRPPLWATPGGECEADELQVMQSHRWFVRAELADRPEPIYPEEILVILPQPGDNT